MYDKSLAQQIIPPNTVWIPAEGGFMREWFLQSTGAPVFIPGETLAKVDPLLPSAARLCRKQVARVTGTLLHDVLDTWYSSVHMTNITGKRLALFEVHELEVLNNIVKIKATGYECVAHIDPATGVTMYLPKWSKWLNEDITKKWLNEHSPGWQTRYALAESLGLKVHDCVCAMLNDDPQVLSAAVPGDLAFSA